MKLNVYMYVCVGVCIYEVNMEDSGSEIRHERKL